MKRNLLALLVVLALIPILLVTAHLTPAQSGDESSPEFVLLLSIDGLRPEFYLDPQGHGMELPTLRDLMRRGVYAEAVTGSYPSVTYPSHTTMITGVPPARHGVYNNYLFDPKGLFRYWYWQSKAIRVPTLWDAVKAKGGTVAAISWPVSVGAPVDFNLPEFHKPGSKQFWWEQLADVMDPRFVEEIEREVGAPADEPFNAEHYETFCFDVTQMVVRKYRPTLVLLHVYNTDSAQHGYGREGPEVVAAFEGTDRRLGALLRTLDEAGIGERTLVVITGDHGFTDLHTLIHLNVAFAQAGLLRIGADGSVVDWDAMAWPSGGSSAVILKDPQDSRARQRVTALIDSLLAGPLAGAMRKITRQELDHLGAMPEALFALEATDGFYFGKNLTGELMTRSGRGGHGFLPTWEKMKTGFIMAGPGVRAGVRIPVMRQVDIAPTIAALAGWELPTAEGLVLRGVFENVR
jgi:predicted AlkP superfamily pyrophosphatase or phosphodiesterase